MSKTEFYTKLSKFVEILSKQDWTPDGYTDKQDYSFISHKKMKNNVSKAITEAKLVWNISYSDYQVCEPIGAMKQHYLLKAIATIRDCEDPDAYETYQAFGEAADSGDKAMAKAQTSGFKAIINNNFFISDLDVEGENVVESNDAIKAQSATSFQANKEIVKEKVIKKYFDPAEHIEPKRSIEGNITDTQRNVLDKIINKARIMSETELMRFGNIAQMESEYAAVKTADDAMKFITAYTGVLRCP